MISFFSGVLACAWATAPRGRRPVGRQESLRSYDSPDFCGAVANAHIISTGGAVLMPCRETLMAKTPTSQADVEGRLERLPGAPMLGLGGLGCALLAPLNPLNIAVSGVDS